MLFDEWGNRDKKLSYQGRENMKRKLFNYKKGILTLGKLAGEGKHTYWKFSQSEKGRSIEAPYIEYIEGEVTVAKNKDKLLSFVNELNIVKCYMYGDFLTKFVFDNENIKFKEINSSQVKYLGVLGEYECDKLLTEKKYSLGEIETIKKIIEFCNSKGDLNYIFYGIFKRNLEFYLRKNEFWETAELMKYLKENYDNQKLISFSECKNHLLELINDF